MKWNYQLLCTHVGRIGICGKFFPDYLKSIGQSVRMP